MVFPPTNLLFYTFGEKTHLFLFYFISAWNILLTTFRFMKKKYFSQPLSSTITTFVRLGSIVFRSYFFFLFISLSCRVLCSRTLYPQEKGRKEEGIRCRKRSPSKVKKMQVSVACFFSPPLCKRRRKNHPALYFCFPPISIFSLQKEGKKEGLGYGAICWKIQTRFYTFYKLYCLKDPFFFCFPLWFILFCRFFF